MDLEKQGERKWNSLKAEVKTGVDKMVAGTASPSDVVAVSRLIAMQSELAAAMFDAGVSNVAAGAKHKVDVAKKKRVDLGKAPLSDRGAERVTTAVMRDMLAASTLDIIKSVDNLIRQQQRDRQLDNAFNRVRQNAPTTGPRDTITAEPVDGQPTATVAKRYVDAMTTGRTQAEAQTPVPSMRQDAKLGSELGVWNSVKKLIGGSKRDPNSLDSFMGKHGARNDEDVKSNTRFASKAPTDSGLQQALNDNRVLRTRAVQEWDRQKNGGREEERADEKRADSWLRRLRTMTGGKKKKESSDSGGLLGALGKGLLLALLHPQLLKTIGDTISEYLNFDTITSFVSSTWDSIKGGGAAVIDYVVSKVKSVFTPDAKGGLPNTMARRSKITQDVMSASSIISSSNPDTSPAASKADIPKFEKRVAGAKASLDRAQAAYTKSPTESNAATLNRSTQGWLIAEGQLEALKGRAGLPSKPRTAAEVEAIINKLPGAETQPKAAAAAASTVTSGGMPAAGSTGPSTAPTTSAIAPGTKPTGSPTATSIATSVPVSSAATTAPAPTTKVEAVSLPVYKPGEAIDPPASNSSGGGVSSMASTGGSFSPVTINSFGFGSGDDTLNLLNMGMLSS